MGLTWELTASEVHNPSSTITQTTNVSGDTTQVRNFQQPASAFLEEIIREGATAGIVRVRSPFLHDNVQGIRWAVSETPQQRLISQYIDQPLVAQDTLIVEATGEASGYDVIGLGIYYTDLPGGAQRLHSLGDIQGNVAQITTQEVSVTAGAAPTAWVDTLITNNYNQLKANRDYAVLGYTVDTAIGLVAIKGADTSNFRVGGPGKILAYDTTEYFVEMGLAKGRPHIPVFNASNAPGTYVSIIDAGNATTCNVTLHLALLTNNLSN